MTWLHWGGEGTLPSEAFRVHKASFKSTWKNKQPKWLQKKRNKVGGKKCKTKSHCWKIYCLFISQTPINHHSLIHSTNIYWGFTTVRDCSSLLSGSCPQPPLPGTQAMPWDQQQTVWEDSWLRNGVCVAAVPLTPKKGVCPSWHLESVSFIRK